MLLFSNRNKQCTAMEEECWMLVTASAEREAGYWMLVTASAEREAGCWIRTTTNVLFTGFFPHFTDI